MWTELSLQVSLHSCIQVKLELKVMNTCVFSSGMFELNLKDKSSRAYYVRDKCRVTFWRNVELMEQKALEVQKEIQHLLT